MLADNVAEKCFNTDRRVREPDFLVPQKIPAFLRNSGNDGQIFWQKLPGLSSQDFSQERPFVTPSDFAPKGLCHNKIHNLTPL